MLRSHLTLALLISLSCGLLAQTFADDLSTLRAHQETIVLSSPDGARQIAVVPAYQGRVMTSTAGGDQGRSYGWINKEHITTGEVSPHINVYGGEDRFWLGPEGGQYALFFPPGSAFTLENWQTPAAIDTEPFTVIQTSETSVSFEKEMTLTNYAGTTFSLDVKRDIRLLDPLDITKQLGIRIPSSVKSVGFSSRNQVTNSGDAAWTQTGGLPSIWILGMFVPSDATTVVIPYRDELKLNTAYFGEIGPDRLKVTNKAVLFKGDGKYRSKIGIPPGNTIPYCGSYDSKTGVLTIVRFSYDPKDALYVNSLWKQQDNPYGGDVINSYNDGPLGDGSQLGPFYELETSSRALALAPGESYAHTHVTCHFEGDKAFLDRIAKEVLGVGLDAISGAFK